MNFTFEIETEFGPIQVKGRPRGAGGSGTKASRWIAVLLLLIAFVFMAFAAATPVTEKFYLFSVKIKIDALITKVTNDFQFGVWGYCSSGVKNSCVLFAPAPSGI